MDTQDHWQSVYVQKSPDSVSWYQATPVHSLALITQAAPDVGARILDIGGGASTLVDALQAAGYTALTVLDLASAALAHAQARLGADAAAVTWVAADVLTVDLPAASVDVWHDRAVFHFLTQPAARVQYVAQVVHALRPGGHVVIATFAEDGPTRCSGLEVARYTPEALQQVFGAAFVLERSEREVHVTPSGSTQAFTYAVFRYGTAPVGQAAA
jgi:2-polyprenyl-3-methyl-5-hydroxy-6-metoxy-1,4-benzoquinol methylase